MNTTCYCVGLRRAARRLSAVYDEALAPVGINVGQFSLLRSIRRHQPVSLTELGRLQELDRSTVGRNVRVLEKLGLVQPAVGDDQREAAVGLTEQGAAVLEAGAPLWDAAQQKIETALGPGNAAGLLAQLEAI